MTNNAGIVELFFWCLSLKYQLHSILTIQIQKCRNKQWSTYYNNNIYTTLSEKKKTFYKSLELAISSSTIFILLDSLERFMIIIELRALGRTAKLRDLKIF